MEARGDVMTDYQMRTLLNLIIKIVKENRDKPDEILKTLLEIRDGEFELKDKPSKTSSED